VQPVDRADLLIAKSIMYAASIHVFGVTRSIDALDDLGIGFQHKREVTNVSAAERSEVAASVPVRVCTHKALAFKRL